jgi:hypothetical protein
MPNELRRRCRLGARVLIGFYFERISSARPRSSSGVRSRLRSLSLRRRCCHAKGGSRIGGDLRIVTETIRATPRAAAGNDMQILAAITVREART